MIRDENSVVQFSNGASLSKCGNDTLLLQVATDRLAAVLQVFLPFSFVLLLLLLFCGCASCTICILNKEVQEVD